MPKENMDWVQQAKEIFRVERPSHFTNYKHCEECAEHDETLKKADIDTIGLGELGNPGWDPICFCSVEGRKYYMPSFIRLSLETINGEFYLGQFLFHLEADDHENDLIKSSTVSQREFIAAFFEHMIESYSDQIQANSYTDEVQKIYQIWSKS